MIAYVGRAVSHAEGARFAPAYVTPEGTLLAATDEALKRALYRFNERRWKAALKS